MCGALQRERSGASEPPNDRDVAIQCQAKSAKHKPTRIITLYPLLQHPSIVPQNRFAAEEIGRTGVGRGTARFQWSADHCMILVESDRVSKAVPNLDLRGMHLREEKWRQNILRADKSLTV